MPDRLFNTSNDCALAFDIDKQKFLFVSPNVTEVLGYAAADFYNDPGLLFSMIDGPDQHRIKDLTDDLSEGKWIELRYFITLANGTRKEVYDKKSRIAGEHPAGNVLLSVINDSQAEKIRYYEQSRLREKFLNSIIDSQTNLIIRFNTVGDFSFANKPFLDLVGYTESELTGKHFSDVTVPDELEMCIEAFKECITTPGTVIPHKHKKRAKNGQIFDTEWEFISITNDEGIVSEVQGIGHDITHKNRIEKEIKSTLQKLDTFIDSIEDSFFILSKDWKFIKVNTAFEKGYEKTREHVLGKVIWDEFPAIVGTGFEDAYRKAAAENITVRFTAYFAPMDKWFNVTIYPSPEGLAVFIRDVSEEKRVQEELTRTRNSLEALINNTEDQIWSLDVEIRYVYMNKAYRNQIARLTGTAPEEGTYSYLHPGYAAPVAEQWTQYYRRGLAGERYAIVVETPDAETGMLESFEVSFNPIYRSENEITGVGCFARNITERIKIENAIIDQNERLRNIASISSHELRRPVASMLGLINVLDRENFYNPENRQVIEHLLTVGNEIDQVIRLIVDHTFRG